MLKYDEGSLFFALFCAATQFCASHTAVMCITYSITQLCASHTVLCSSSVLHIQYFPGFCSTSREAVQNLLEDNYLVSSRKVDIVLFVQRAQKTAQRTKLSAVQSTKLIVWPGLVLETVVLYTVGLGEREGRRDSQLHDETVKVYDLVVLV